MTGFLGWLRTTEHRFCRENLSAYLDGQLDSRAQVRVERHLRECQDCQVELDSLRRTVELIHALPRLRAPRAFFIPHTAPAPTLPIWMRPAVQNSLRWASGLAAALLLVALVGRSLSLSGLAILPAQPRTMMAERALLQSAAEDAAMPERQIKAAPDEVQRSPEGTPSGRGGRTEATEAAGGGALAGSTPTLTPEEEARAAAAPPGMGEGPAAEPLAATEAPAVAAAPAEP
ncbi:MAG: anti-sigma factor family protein, partial [Anaerolineae bacterium]